MDTSGEKRAWSAMPHGKADTIFRTGLRGTERAMIVLEQEKCEFVRIFKPPSWGERSFQDDSN
ncbi:hypothetical protein O3301_14190 [Janthinobacterium sp. SUN211]|uniref:hypothetical protein n=1 Tax=Janthinobacterium sp. SUN211 TaxID=3014786 RepID=UPI0027136F20|nr:hypothetical protein [Janthinobacterium sp. SUN211]MDO8049614.1 hypothetical protein [Janthinobacterium sp. SUN211]